MDIEMLDDLVKAYNDRSLDDFLAVWRELSEGRCPQGDIMRLDEAVVGAYVARLKSAADIETVLVDLRLDKRVRARECIEIAARLLPGHRRPRSRNRALAQIRAGRAASVRAAGRRAAVAASTKAATSRSAAEQRTRGETEAPTAS